MRNPCSALPRRLQIVVTLTTTLLLAIILLLANSSTDQLESVPYGPQLKSDVDAALSNAQQVVDRLPHLNPFGTPAHPPPPEQANSVSGDTRWYSDWKWRNPFSSDVTRDEERAVLPPLRVRPAVYTYFDPAGRRKDEESRVAEQELLKTWRRAWWASGFHPVVLTKSEAMQNPLYRKVQGMGLSDGVMGELMRWLAWASMNGGILTNFLAVPMAVGYDDATLAYLRRGEYPVLTAYEGLGSGLYVGDKEAVADAVHQVVDSPALKSVGKLDEAFPKDTITVDAPPASIAFYSLANLKAKYAPIRDLLDGGNIGEAMTMLPDLITSHLHANWREGFPKGISVVKPLPAKSTSLIESAIDIARNLSSCPISPIPTSCPPNRPKCKPCVSSTMAINTPKVFRNDSSTFTIGIVPHPWTIQTIVKDRQDMDVAFIRRKTDRDIWIEALTKELLGAGVSSHMRLPSLKNAVATEYGNAQSLWLTPEAPLEIESLDWIFGFRIPRETLPTGKSETPVPGPERRPPKPKAEFGDGPVPTEQVLKRERELFDLGKRWLKERKNEEIRGVVEGWNLADTEGWKFVRAWNARREEERRGWERGEVGFVGGRRRDLLGKGLLGRWVD
uniref:Uncharacterized protein n=1 Tax=Ramularia collo-cygni TaxID=112498 RepID=A0A2D3UNT9_9PEZI